MAKKKGGTKDEISDETVQYVKEEAKEILERLERIDFSFLKEAEGADGAKPGDKAAARVEAIETDDAFQKAIAGHDVVAVDFFTTWCFPCKMFSPKLDAVLDQLRREGRNNVAIYKVDCEKSNKVADGFGIRSVPSLVIFVKGKADKAVIVGNEEKQLVLDRMNEILKDVDAYASKMGFLDQAAR
jgi:thioredoxin 1